MSGFRLSVDGANQKERTMNAIRKEAIHEFLHGDKKLAWELNQQATLAEQAERAAAKSTPELLNQAAVMLSTCCVEGTEVTQ